MDRFVEQPLAPSLGSFAIARILFNVGDHPRVEDRLAIRLGIEPTIEIEIGASQVQPDLLGHLLQGLQALRQEHRICFIDGSHGDGSYDIPMVVDDSDDFLALLVLVAGIADAIAPFLATVLVPSP